MINTQLVRLGLPTILLALMALPAGAQSFRGVAVSDRHHHAPVSPTQ